MNVSEMIQSTIDGESDPLLIYAELKKELMLLDDQKKRIQEGLNEIHDYVLQEASKEDKTFIKHGCSFTYRNGSTRYSFKHLEEWVQYDQNKKDCEARFKLAYKNSQSGMMMVSDDGEVVELPIVTHDKDSLLIKLL